MRKYDHPTKEKRARQSRFRLFLLLAFGLFVGIGQTSAQDCLLACNGTLEAPLQVAIDQTCIANLNTDNIIEAPQSCPGDKELVVRDSFNNIVTQSINNISFDADPYIGQALSVTVTDTESGIFCVGFILIVDNVAPTFQSCPNELVECVAALVPDSLVMPTVADNCNSPLLSLEFTDAFTAADCLSDTAGVLNRSWTAIDSSGNFANCTQSIYVLRPELDSIVFPTDLVLAACDTNLVTSPDSLGRPSLDSVLIMNGGLCGFSIEYSDDTTALCGQSYQITRTWSVSSDCSGFEREEVQQIMIQDTIPPTAICDTDPIIVQTDPAQCYATVSLPTPGYTDNCDAPVEFFANTSYGATGFLPHPFVPTGTHTVQYTLLDACGNFSICNRELIVIDEESPTAVCEDQTLVSIPNTGTAAVQAITFDDGSIDNCNANLFYKARRMQSGGCNGLNGDDNSIPGYQEWFDDFVQFCCEEIGDEVMVIMRVYEVDPGQGPVTPTREQPGGDLFGHFTECMLTVSLQDALPPLMSCPSNQTIDCATDVSDLSIFGQVTVQENCGFDIDSTSVSDFDECGRGTILRTWTAIDGAGLSNSCQQTITVTNENALTEDDIVWPENFTTEICGTPTDPDDLPAGFDVPTILIEGCGDIVYEHEDLHFDLDQSACFKILRTWTVLDWCHYDPDAGTGQFTHTQIIKIRDTENPVLTVPQGGVFPATNCVDGYVSLGSATAQDCSDDVIITNDSPYADNNGANASGDYPEGTTVVTFTASDKCGNVSTQQIEITVVDNLSPEPVCIVGLSVNLSNMNGEIMASIDASAFDGGSSDPCTIGDDLIRTIRRPDENAEGAPNTTELMFTCEDIGTQLVEFWVRDEAGNANYCLTLIAVQDNQGLCPATQEMAMVAGGVLTEDGEEVEEVEVRILGPDPTYMMTGIDGAFMFEDLAVGEDYSVYAVRDDDILNGVTTFDLIQMSKHLLGVKLLDSPYKIIAADIDKSGHVSTFDVIRLRKVILGIDESFPNDNKSWRFIDASYEFPDPTNPWATYFPELYSINDLDGDEMYVDFIGVKVGDVNGTATPNSFAAHGEVASRSRPQEGLSFRTADITYQADETIEIPVYGDYMDELEGYQFTLEFNPDLLDLQEVIPGDLPNLYEENFGMVNLENGIITSLWTEYDQSAAGQATLLFTLSFKAKAGGQLSESLFMGSRITQAEAYDKNGDIFDLELDFTTMDAEEAGFELFQNRPNPFSDETIIPFQLNEAGMAQLTVYDMAGKVVYRTDGDYDPGYHEIAIKESDLPTSGLFYYTLNANGQQATRKMVLTD